MCISYPFVQMSEVLQEAGGQLERSEIRDRISELDEHIAEFEQKLYTFNKTGNQYKKFDFKFNFAIKELSYVGLICHLPVHEYFQVSGVSKSRLTDNIEKRIIIIRGGISHTNACVGGVDNGSNERLCCPSG